MNIRSIWPITGSQFTNTHFVTFDCSKTMHSLVDCEQALTLMCQSHACGLLKNAAFSHKLRADKHTDVSITCLCGELNMLDVWKISRVCSNRLKLKFESIWPITRYQSNNNHFVTLELSKTMHFFKKDEHTSTDVSVTCLRGILSVLNEWKMFAN